MNVEILFNTLEKEKKMSIQIFIQIFKLVSI